MIKYIIAYSIIIFGSIFLLVGVLLGQLVKFTLGISKNDY